LISAELPLDGGQPGLTLPELRLGQAVGVLGAQGVTQLPQGLEVLPRLGEAPLRREASLGDVDGATTVSEEQADSRWATPATQT